MTTPNDRGFTPFENPKSISDCWIDETYAFLSSSTLADAQKQTLIVAACGMVNDFCGRYFNKQEADEIIVLPLQQLKILDTYRLKNDPINSITDIYLQINETFEQLDLNELQILYDKNLIRFSPVASGLIGQLSEVFTRSMEEKNFWIRYDAGYAAADVPETVKMATAFLYNHLLKTSQSGDVVEFSTQTYREKRDSSSQSSSLQSAYSLLKDYKSMTLAT